MANLKAKSTFSHRLACGVWLVSGLQEWQFIRHLDGENYQIRPFSGGNLLDDTVDGKNPAPVDG